MEVSGLSQSLGVMTKYSGWLRKVVMKHIHDSKGSSKDRSWSVRQEYLQKLFGTVANVLGVVRIQKKRRQ